MVVIARSNLDKLKTEFIPDNITWSFSSVNNYNNCPKCFWLSYLQDPKLEKSQNAFAEWGSFGHSLFERYVKGELELYEMGSKYEEEYRKNITLKFPPNKYVNLDEIYYEKGKEYFDNFEGFPNNWELIASEQEIRFEIKGKPFIGYIDLIAKDKNTGKYIIVDHKSKSKFKDENEKNEYARQLYLYSLYIKQKYGEYPSRLIFNMFRANDVVIIEFNEKSLQEAVDWFVNTIESIQRDDKFADKISLSFKKQGKKLKDFKKGDFFCNYLCGVREHCNRSKFYKGGDKHNR